MKVLSLFSGVGGFDLGLERAGMQTVFQCEWDKHATKILERHWPDVPRWDDVSTLTGAHVLQHAPVIDVVAWGSPCQDLSVAGKRAGLGGERSGLFHQGIRIIKEIRELTNGQYPRISIWENVAGALSSSNGADFGEVLYEMDEAGACFSEWRMLDAQYFGVPQRRRRVFVISIFDPATAARCPNPLLPVSESVCRDIEASGTERQEPTGTVEQSLASGRDIANTISAELYHKSTVVNQDVNNGHLIVGSLAARDYKGVGNQYVNEGKCVVETFTEEALAFDGYNQTVGNVSQTIRADKSDGDHVGMVLQTFTKAKPAQSTTDDETWVEGKPAPTLNAFDQGDTRATTVVVGEERTYRNVTGALLGRDSFGPNHEGARDGKLILEPSAVVIREREGKAGGGKGPLYGEEKSHSLIASNDQKLFVEEPILLDGRRVDDVRVYDPPVQTLQARMGTGGNNVPLIGFSHTQGLSSQPMAYDEYNDTLGGDIHHALRAGTKQSTGVIEPTMAVRRLTPVECERLMGWPDDWTAGQADTHRYKQCGNGVASPVATWIGQQLINL